MGRSLCPPHEMYITTCNSRTHPFVLRRLADRELFQWMQEHGLWYSLMALRDSAAEAQVLVGCLNKIDMRRALGLAAIEYTSVRRWCYEDFIAVVHPGFVIDHVPERPGTSRQVWMTAVKLTDSSSQP